MSMSDSEFLELARLNTGCETGAQHLLRAGGVLRYHNEPLVPCQEVGLHTWRVMTILLSIWPDSSRELMLAVQFHDAGEGLTGDIPAPVKWADPELRSSVGRMDRRYVHEICGVPEVVLTATEIGRMKCADYLELMDYCSNFQSEPAQRIKKTGFSAVRKFSERLSAEDRKALAQYVRKMSPTWTGATVGSADKEFATSIHEYIMELKRDATE